MQFRYEVTDKMGKPLRGVMDAPSEADVRQRLISRGYVVKAVVPASAPSAQPQPRPQPASPYAAALGPTMRINPPAKELGVFFRGLASLLQSGIPVHQSLVQIGTQSPNRALRFICDRMASRVQAGHRLSLAMAEFPNAFPPHVIGVVTAGEMGGFLPVVIGDIALDYEIAQRASVRFGKVINWFLWINALAPLPFVLIPTAMFSKTTAVAGDVKAGIVQGLMSGLTFIGLPMLFLIAAYFITLAVLKQPSMRPVRDNLILRLPWAGRASRERSLASFTRMLWRLQNAGILPINAWDTASRAAENSVIARKLHAEVDAIRSGRRFSEALADTGLFTSEDQRVLAIAETAGQVPDVLQRLAVYYEDAAMFSMGRVKWLGIRIAIVANLISIGIVTISLASIYPAMFKWVDEFMNVQ